MPLPDSDMTPVRSGFNDLVRTATALLTAWTASHLTGQSVDTQTANELATSTGALFQGVTVLGVSMGLAWLGAKIRGNGTKVPF